jgi:anti-anti-sigma factor
MNRAHDDPFDIAIQSCGGRLRILLSGELDIAGVDLLDEVVGVVQGAQLPFSLGCDQLTFIDCAGVGALLRAARRGGEIDGVHGQVQRVFDILGLNPEFTPPAD